MRIFGGDRSSTNFQVESPKVSIIIFSCNTRYLSEAIDSVLEQTYKDHEIIVIDETSTDNTKEVIEAYQANIRYIHQNEHGVSAARNYGIELAKGELVAFLDANDLFLPDKLEQQVAIFEAQPDVDIVNSGYRVIKDNGNMVMDVKRWHEIPELTPEAWLLDKPVFPSAIMFRRACFDRFGGFQQRFSPYEDIEITLRMVIKGCQSAWLSKVTVCYRLQDCSADPLDTDAVITQLETAAAMQEYLFSQSQIPRSIRRLENKSSFYGFTCLAWLCYQSGLYSKMVEYLEKSQDYVSCSQSEMIDKWIDTFANCAQTHACDFDANALNNLQHWQEFIANLQASHLTVKPLVSVIIPSYNCAQYLPKAIESVLNQTDNNYEIIVIDDGSTDNTKEVIEPYFANIRYVYQENRGADEATNRGLYLARGVLIIFLSADEMFLPNKLKEQVAIFEQPNISITNSGYRLIKENDEVVAVIDIQRWQEISESTFKAWLLNKPVFPSAMMFRREWFNRLENFNNALILLTKIDAGDASIINIAPYH